MKQKDYFRLRFEIAASGLSVRQYLGSKRATYARHHRKTGLPQVKGGDRFFFDELRYLGIDPKRSIPDDLNYPADVAAERILKRPTTAPAVTATKPPSKRQVRGGICNTDAVLVEARKYPDNLGWATLRLDIVADEIKAGKKEKPKTYTASEYVGPWAEMMTRFKERN